MESLKMYKDVQPLREEVHEEVLNFRDFPDEDCGSAETNNDDIGQETFYEPGDEYTHS